ncbi:MAG: hypothetical protein J6M53_02585 [Bacteroidaceae bacterium]|nr:hypothetical protein [Bacteroidaceae bacterium]
MRHTVLAILLCFALTLAAQEVPLCRGGLSTHTGVPVGDADTVAASLDTLKARGITALRIELRGPLALERLDTLLVLTDKAAMAVTLAVPDTLLSALGLDAVTGRAASHSVKTWTLMRTATTPADTLLRQVRALAAATPAARHGVSFVSAGETLFQLVVSEPCVDYLGLRLGYEDQRWASRDRVREAIGQVFSRMPDVLHNALRQLELADKPLVIDYVNYPRDRAAHYPGTPVSMRNNVVNYVQHLAGGWPGKIAAFYVGDWTGDTSFLPYPPTETLYNSDDTIWLIAGQTPSEAQ